MTYIDAIILGIIEGLTEFLPISSTGHLILGAKFLGLEQTTLIELFEIFIQLGAILAVVLLQRKKISHTLCNIKQAESRNFALSVIVATIPAVIMGLLFSKWFKLHFFNPTSVSITLIIGGIIILLVDRPNKSNSNSNSNGNISTINDINIITAIKIGLMQCLALIPGTSRSGATIIGAMALGVPRVIATEFSFFLAIPIIFGASLHDVYKSRDALNSDVVILLLIGSLVSFITAWLCIKWLMKYVSSHSFVSFAWYRIIFGIILLCGLKFM
jgi:undecaprenyl-diphosphatase